MAEREPGHGPAGDPVIDLREEPQTARAAPGAPPVPGAQWDELHGCWEVWDEADQVWRIVGHGSGVREAAQPRSAAAARTAAAEAAAAAALPPRLLRELLHAQEIDPVEEHVIDLDRLARPPQPVRGAQWNEVAGRWERWDEVAGEWVEARAEEPSDASAP